MIDEGKIKKGDKRFCICLSILTISNVFELDGYMFSYFQSFLNIVRQMQNLVGFCYVFVNSSASLLFGKKTKNLIPILKQKRKTNPKSFFKESKLTYKVNILNFETKTTF